jgi:hypothetical protein
MMRWFYDLFGKAEDKRYEYRIKKVPFYNTRYPDHRHQYVAQYKGWFLWHNIDWWFNEATARATCEVHAARRVSLSEPREAGIINLGKLP